MVTQNAQYLTDKPHSEEGRKFGNIHPPPEARVAPRVSKKAVATGGSSVSPLSRLLKKSFEADFRSADQVGQGFEVDLYPVDTAQRRNRRTTPGAARKRPKGFFSSLLGKHFGRQRGPRAWY